MSVTVYRTWELKGVPIPVAARSNVWVIGRCIVAIAGLNPARGQRYLSAPKFSVFVEHCRIAHSTLFKLNHTITHTTLDSPHYRAVSTRFPILEAHCSSLSPKIGYPDLYHCLILIVVHVYLLLSTYS